MGTIIQNLALSGWNYRPNTFLAAVFAEIGVILQFAWAKRLNYMQDRLFNAKK
jgi:hypothetical protein